MENGVFKSRTILTFTVSGTLALETASTAARQGSTVIPAELIRLDLKLLGLAGTASGVRVPSVIWMQETKFRTTAVALRIVAVTSIP